MKTRKRIMMMMLVLAALVIFTGIFGWNEYTRKKEPIKVLEPASEVVVTRLIQEFDINVSIASKKYLGKLIAVNGTIKKPDKDDKGFFRVVMGDAGVITSVSCAMGLLFANEVITLQAGQTIAIKAMFTGFQRDDTGLLGSDIILNRGVIDKTLTNKQD